MSNDAIKKISNSRVFYQGQDKGKDEVMTELSAIKNELKIANDTNALVESSITNATGSPYLKDKDFYYKDVIFNSEQETSWRDVKSYDELYNSTASYNLKKLNII
jgi:hypothetical protein